jgi:hypothetical protein
MGSNVVRNTALFGLDAFFGYRKLEMFKLLDRARDRRMIKAQ